LSSIFHCLNLSSLFVISACLLTTGTYKEFVIDVVSTFTFGILASVFVSCVILIAFALLSVLLLWSSFSLLSLVLLTSSNTSFTLFALLLCATIFNALFSLYFISYANLELMSSLTTSDLYCCFTFICLWLSALLTSSFFIHSEGLFYSEFTFIIPFYLTLCLYWICRPVSLLIFEFPNGLSRFCYWV
jgi:hypothetical protein